MFYMTRNHLIYVYNYNNDVLVYWISFPYRISSERFIW